MSQTPLWDQLDQLIQFCNLATIIINSYNKGGHQTPFLLLVIGEFYMQVRLNETRASMVQIDTHFLTFRNPGPVDIDLDKLDKSRLNQLLYNIRKGVIVKPPEDEMHKLLALTNQLPAASNRFVTPEENKLNNEDSSRLMTLSRMAEEEDKLKKVLKGNIDTVKKEVGTMSLSQVRKVLDIEVHTRNRPSLVKWLDTLVQSHTNQVTRDLYAKPSNDQVKNQSDLVKKGLGNGIVDLDNIGDIVESDVEQVTLNPYADED